MLISAKFTWIFSCVACKKAFYGWTHFWAYGYPRRFLCVRSMQAFLRTYVMVPMYCWYSRLSSRIERSFELRRSKIGASGFFFGDPNSKGWVKLWGRAFIDTVYCMREMVYCTALCTPNCRYFPPLYSLRKSIIAFHSILRDLNISQHLFPSRRFYNSRWGFVLTSSSWGNCEFQQPLKQWVLSGIWIIAIFGSLKLVAWKVGAYKEIRRLQVLGVSLSNFFERERSNINPQFQLLVHKSYAYWNPLIDLIQQ